MLISMLKYIKIFKGTPTCFDLNTVQRTALQGSPRTPATCIAATTPGLIVRILKF